MWLNSLTITMTIDTLFLLHSLEFLLHFQYLLALLLFVVFDISSHNLLCDVCQRANFNFCVQVWLQKLAQLVAPNNCFHFFEVFSG